MKRVMGELRMIYRLGAALAATIALGGGSPTGRVPTLTIPILRFATMEVSDAPIGTSDDFLLLAPVSLLHWIEPALEAEPDCALIDSGPSLAAVEPQGTRPAGQKSPAATKPFVDFTRIEFMPFIGGVHFSGEFEADPSFSAGLHVRVPMPGILNGNFGAFTEFLFSTLERDLDPPHDDNEDNFYCFALGADYTFVRNTTWLVAAQLGAVYVTYGDIVAVDDGVGLLAGVVAGVHLFGPKTNVWITYNPQFAWDGDDWMLFHHLGVLFSF